MLEDKNINKTTSSFYDDNAELILRDHLAIERTKLANERTLLSYIRTSLYLITAGFGLTEIDIFLHLKIAGYLAFFVGFIFLMVGIWRFISVKKRLQK